MEKLALNNPMLIHVIANNAHLRPALIFTYIRLSHINLMGGVGGCGSLDTNGLGGMTKVTQEARGSQEQFAYFQVLCFKWDL